MKIFLDMDGVLVDFVSGLHKRMVMEYDEQAYPYKLGEYEMLGFVADKKGIKLNHVFEVTSRPLFWTGLEWEPNGRAILEAAYKSVGQDNVYLLSAPMARDGVWSGKVRWVQANIPELLPRMIISSAPKHLLANGDSLLIDDKDKNIDGFRLAGGRGVLVPRPWNSRYMDRGADIVQEIYEASQKN